MSNTSHHDHPHGHDRDHHKLPASFDEVRTMAIESLLIEKGLISAEEVDNVISTFVSDIGPMYGAKVIARAWVDPDYKQRLLQDGNQALAEMDFGDVVEHLASAVYSDLIALENTPDIIPERPPGTEQMSEDELAALITRDAMIGVAKVSPPA
jgi:nitrile hydratase subunit alpha